MASKKEDTIRCCTKRGLNSMPLFIFSASALFVFARTGTFYLGGVIRTLERRFSLRSSQAGFLHSCDNITSMFIVLFIGYFGRWGHKPRIICIINLFTALSFLLMAIPYFAFDSTPVIATTAVLQAENTPSGNNASFLPRTRTKFCLSAFPNKTGSDNINMCNATYWPNSDGASSERKGVHPAYYVFIFAQLLSGVGTSGVQTLGLTYIDENAPKSRVSLYVGIVNSMYTLGPVGGLLLSAITLRLPEDLSKVLERPDNSAFIGCWWLGYVICGMMVTVFSIPMWFYPKRMASNESPPEEQIANISSQEQPAERSVGVKAQIKEFPRSFRRLMCNKMFLVNVGCTLTQAYILTGINANMVRYIEIHFLEQAFVASLITAIAVAMAMGLGTFLGGFLMSRMRLSPRGGVRLMLGASSIFAVGLFALMFVSCPQVEMAGNVDSRTGTLNVMNGCNYHCSCKSDRKSYVPVCGSDNLSYFSSCFAGCSESRNGTFVGCSCVGGRSSHQTVLNSSSFSTFENLISGTAQRGLCSGRCRLLIPFAILSFVTYLLGSMAIVPGTLLNFRVVESKDKSFAIAFSKFIMDILGFVPAPLFFGRLVDSSCRMWQRTAAIPSSTWFTGCTPPDFTSDETGSCLLFDTAKVRRQLYGTTFGIKLFEIVLNVILFKHVRGAVTGDAAGDGGEKAITDTTIELQDCSHKRDAANVEEERFLGQQEKNDNAIMSD